MFLKNKVLLIAGVVSLMACGAKSTNEAKQEAQNLVEANGNKAVDTAVYSSPCASSSIPDIGDIKFPGKKTVYELSPLNFTKRIYYYTDGNCRNEAVLVSESGKIKVQGQSASVPGALEEDFQFDKTSVKLQNDTIVKAFNLLKVCNVQDSSWAMGIDKDVTANSNDMKCPGKPSPRISQDLVLISNGNLILGADTDSPNRPVQVDQTNVYSKQP